MDVTLIPFILAAKVFVQDMSEWTTYGPEYVYDLNITYDITPEPPAPVDNSRQEVDNIQLIATLNCRPKHNEHLFCQVKNATEITNDNRNEQGLKYALMDRAFEIVFNERGVEGLIIDVTHTQAVDLVRKIANQFNVLSNRSKIDEWQFYTREGTAMGDCWTAYRISREEPATEEFKIAGTDFRFVILPFVDMKPGTAFSITKTRMECKNSPTSVDFVAGSLGMMKFYTTTEILPNKFEVSSVFVGKVTGTQSGKEILTFKEIIYINLNSIKPAQGEVPHVHMGELFDLTANTQISGTMVDD